MSIYAGYSVTTHLSQLYQKCIVLEIRTMCLDILQISITYIISSFTTDNDSAVILEVNI